MLKKNEIIGKPMELTVKENAMVNQGKWGFYYEIKRESCDFYPNGENPDWPYFCSNEQDEKYYISDPIPYYELNADDKYTLEKSERVITLSFQDDKPVFFVQYITETSSRIDGKSYSEPFKKYFDSLTNFVLVADGKSAWIVSMDNVEMLEGVSDVEIDFDLLRRIRKEILSKNQYSFYKHEIDMDEFNKFYWQEIDLIS